MSTVPVVHLSPPKPLIEGRPTRFMQFLIWAFVVVPFAAVVIAIPATWMWGIGPNALDLAMAFVLFVISCAGVGVGYHRYFTHGSFKANRGLRVGLAMAGSLSVEGNIIQWVADHRRHHAFADVEGDPHSPWRFGKTPWPLAKGLLYAHAGWLFDREFTNRKRFAPDLMNDKDIARIDRLFPLMVALSLGGPALIGGLATWSWAGALSAFFWAGLVRIAVLHHVTWSINSVCHVFGERPFETTKEGDRAANFWPLAIISFGESWHNLHHADPTCARHGVLKGQVDINARIIWLFERLGWATNVKWPKQDRLDERRRLEPAV